jgi:hypothetical protein
MMLRTVLARKMSIKGMVKNTSEDKRVKKKFIKSLQLDLLFKP